MKFRPHFPTYLDFRPYLSLILLLLLPPGNHLWPTFQPLLIPVCQFLTDRPVILCCCPSSGLVLACLPDFPETFGLSPVLPHNKTSITKTPEISHMIFFQFLSFSIIKKRCHIKKWNSPHSSFLGTTLSLVQQAFQENKHLEFPTMGHVLVLVPSDNPSSGTCFSCDLHSD